MTWIEQSCPESMSKSYRLDGCLEASPGGVVSEGQGQFELPPLPVILRVALRQLGHVPDRLTVAAHHN
jgi:hypothetical protein